LFSKILNEAEEREKFYKNRTKKKSGSTGAEDLLANEKIRAQIALDVDQYEKELGLLGIDPTRLTSFQELKYLSTLQPSASDQ
jgi:hypothetical protein